MMKLLTCLIFFSFGQFAMAEKLVGTWKYKEYKHEGLMLPAPDTSLDLRFTFTDKGEAYMKWLHKGNHGFCQRRAEYKVEGGMLWQKVVWLNPSNDQTCGSDPEMQVDQETTTKFNIKDNRLNLDIGLAGKPFIYIFHSVSGDVTNQK